MTLYQRINSLRVPIGISVGLFACCAAFSALGFWQISRFEEKRLVEGRLEASLPGSPQSLNAGSAVFSRVSAAGYYDASRIFLIDNRIHQGQAGVQVIQAFDDQSGERILVDRGWMPYPERQSPPVPTPSPHARVELIGLLLPDFGAGFSLQDPSSEIHEMRSPMLLPQLDVRMMSELAATRAGQILRLRSGEPGALVTKPFELPMSAQRHRGYAVQWFALALAAISIWAVLACRYLVTVSTHD